MCGLQHVYLFLNSVSQLSRCSTKAEGVIYVLGCEELSPPGRGYFMAVRLLDLQLIYGLAGAREKFEQLCAQLIRSTFSEAKGIRVHQGDGGIDTYTGKWGESGDLHVFQVKFFPAGLGDDQKRQVKKSLESCLANTHFRTVKWTLCLPLDLSLDETTWFENWKHTVARDSLTSDNIDYWGETELSELLFKSENRGIKEAFFKEEYLTQVREMHEMLINLLHDITTRVEESVHEAVRQQRTSLSAFQTVEEFYQPFLNSDHLFHHTLPLIGRESSLKKLLEFFRSQGQIALISGPDGVGKSRLLLEALRQTEKELEDRKVLMLCTTFIATHEHELADGQILIGVDDALTYDKDHLDELFRRVRRYPGRVKLILAIRQDDLDEMRQHLFLANFQPEEILELPLLQEVEKPIELAKAILGKEDLDPISQLVALASDSPLIMVIAGELLKRGLIHHSILALSHDDFRQRVVSRYQQILPRNSTFPILDSKVKDVRALLYAIGPFDTRNAAFVTKAVIFLQVTSDEFLETLDLLVKVGMAIRQGESYSCIPNALTYPILEQACFTSSGKIKEFGPRIAVEFTEPWETNALKRLAEVDWLKGKGQSTGLLTPYWQTQEKLFHSSSTEECINILRIINAVAYLQPKAAFDFVEMALRVPDTLPSPSGNTESVQEQIKLYLPSILGQIAHYIDYTKVAITLLWNLGKNDFGDISKSSTHPHQILQQLSKLRYNSTVAYYGAYLQCVEGWCNELGAFDHDFTPLDLIPSFLVREGYEDYYFPQTQSIHMQHFQISLEPMKDIRKRAIHLLVSIGQMNEKPKLQYHAIEILCNIVMGGLVYNNTPDLRAQWYEEDRAILAEIADIAQRAENIFLAYTIEYKLRIALKHPENAALTENLRATLAALPLDLNTDMLWYLMHQKSAAQFSNEPMNEQEGGNNSIIRDVAERVLHIYPTAQSLKKKLDDLCFHLAIYDQHIVFPYFLELLIEINPVLGCELCMLIVNDPSSSVVDYFTSLAIPVRQWNTIAFLDLVRDALKSDIPKLRQGAAYALCAFTAFTDEESAIIISLIKDSDPIIATRAIYVIHQLPKNKQQTIFFTLDEVSITSHDEAKVNAMCEVLHQQMNNPTWDPISFMSSFLQKCVPLPTLSEHKYYRLCSFLLEYRWRYSQIVANFYLARVKHRRLLPEEQQQSYEFVSCMSSPLIVEVRNRNDMENENTAYERYKVLCTIRDEFLKFEEDEIIMIFAYFANGYDLVALQAFSEWLESSEEQKFRLVAKLLRKAPPTFVFDNQDFIEKLLSTATQINTNAREQMCAALLSSAMPFAFVGLPDLLSHERIQIRDRAQQIANTYSLGSIMRAFYIDISKEAENRIEIQRSFLAGQ